MIEILPYIAPFAGLFCLAAGITGLVKPHVVAQHVSLQMQGAMGVLEVRCMFGGLFIGLAGTCLLTAHPIAYLSFSSVWLGGAAAKYLSVIIDKPPFWKGFTSATIDLMVGLALLSGYFFP